MTTKRYDDRIIVRAVPVCTRTAEDEQLVERVFPSVCDTITGLGVSTILFDLFVGSTTRISELRGFTYCNHEFRFTSSLLIGLMDSIGMKVSESMKACPENYTPNLLACIIIAWARQDKDRMTALLAEMDHFIREFLLPAHDLEDEGDRRIVFEGKLYRYTVDFHAWPYKKLAEEALISWRPAEYLTSPPAPTRESRQ